MSGTQVVIRYYEAHPPRSEKVPICAVARLSGNQLRKLPESKPGMAILEFSVASAYIVEAFRQGGSTNPIAKVARARKLAKKAAGQP